MFSVMLMEEDVGEGRVLTRLVTDVGTGFGKSRNLVMQGILKPDLREGILISRPASGEGLPCVAWEGNHAVARSRGTWAQG